jgi:hypothetical protein
MLNNQLKLYKVLTYILLPIGYFFGIIDVMFFMSALANPATLIFVFVIACLVIYTLTSYKFYNQGILKEQILKAKLKDWIKVNAYVSLFLCSLFFLNSISILISSNATLYKFIDDLISQQPNFPKEATPALILSILKIVASFLFITSAVALLHIRITLKLVKENGHLFEKQ